LTPAALIDQGIQAVGYLTSEAFGLVPGLRSPPSLSSAWSRSR
jgi:hypothetical protein